MPKNRAELNKLAYSNQDHVSKIDLIRIWRTNSKKETLPRNIYLVLTFNRDKHSTFNSIFLVRSASLIGPMENLQIEEFETSERIPTSEQAVL